MSKNVIADYLICCELSSKLSTATDECVHLMGIVADLYDELISVLTDEQKILLDKFRNALDDHQSEEVEQYFSEGFKAGLLFGLEINK